ncbi:hypothetical protein GCM10027056_19080 [Glaciibacter psychrotolerans]
MEALEVAGGEQSELFQVFEDGDIALGQMLLEGADALPNVHRNLRAADRCLSPATQGESPPTVVEDRQNRGERGGGCSS